MSDAPNQTAMRRHRPTCNCLPCTLARLAAAEDAKIQAIVERHIAKGEPAP